MGRLLSERRDRSEIIDPQGFAIYPATNGKVIAWLDNLESFPGQS